VGAVRRITRGAVAGAAATAAMSAVMLACQRLGLVGKQPPEHITEQALDAADVDRDEPSENAATVAAHFAYGIGNGAAFALVARRLPGSAVTRGLIFASGLLLVSYEGWVPAARILPPLRSQAPGTAWTLVAGHVTYGAVLGAVAGSR